MSLWTFKSGRVTFTVFAEELKEALHKFGRYIRETGRAVELALLIAIHREPSDPQGEKIYLTSLFLVEYAGYSAEEAALFESRWLRSHGVDVSYGDSLSRIKSFFAEVRER